MLIMPFLRSSPLFSETLALFKNQYSKITPLLNGVLDPLGYFRTMCFDLDSHIISTVLDPLAHIITSGLDRLEHFRSILFNKIDRRVDHISSCIIHSRFFAIQTFYSSIHCVSKPISSICEDESILKQNVLSFCEICSKRNHFNCRLSVLSPCNT